jgi:hypothetical protein
VQFAHQRQNSLPVACGRSTFAWTTRRSLAWTRSGLGQVEKRRRLMPGEHIGS